MSIQVGQEVKGLMAMIGDKGIVTAIGSGVYENCIKVKFNFYGECWISGINGDDASWTEQEVAAEPTEEVQPVQEATAPIAAASEKSPEELDDLRRRRIAKAEAYIARIDADAPALVGSPAQVKWAESIRTPHLEQVRKSVHSHFVYDAGRLISIESYHISGGELKRLRQLAEDHDNTSASWYIDNRRALSAV